MVSRVSVVVFKNGESEESRLEGFRITGLSIEIWGAVRCSGDSSRPPTRQPSSP